MKRLIKSSRRVTLTFIQRLQAIILRRRATHLSLYIYMNKLSFEKHLPPRRGKFELHWPPKKKYSRTHYRRRARRQNYRTCSGNSREMCGTHKVKRELLSRSRYTHIHRGQWKMAANFAGGTSLTYTRRKWIHRFSVYSIYTRTCSIEARRNVLNAGYKNISAHAYVPRKKC